MQTKKESNSTLLYLTKLPRHSSTGIITKSKASTFTSQHHPLPRVQSHFHQCTWLISSALLSSSAVRSSSIFWLRFCPWFEPQLIGYSNFFLFSSCPLMCPTLKVGSFEKLFLPESTGILPLILMGFELVSVAFSSLSTNYCIEAKSSVLLSVAQFPGTFSCQTGFFNILIYIWGFSPVLFILTVSHLLKTTYSCEYMCSLFLIIADPRDSKPLLQTARKNAQHYALPDSCSSSTSALQSLIQHPDSSLHIV